MVKAVIFDVDGTLIDSVDQHAQAWQDTFAKFGFKTDFQAVRDEIGKGGDKLLEVFLSKDQIERQGKEIEEERTELFKREYLSQLKPFPGLEELFKRLHGDGVRLALASSAKGDELQTYKKITGIESFLSEETSSDDVSSSKPDPDIFLSAQKKLGFDPQDIVVVGDSRYDAESASKAGIATIGLLCGGSSPAQLREAGCIALYQDPADLLKNYATSPLVSRGPSRNSRKSGSWNKRPYFFIGLGIGVAVGMLCASKSGSETRAYLLEQF